MIAAGYIRKLRRILRGYLRIMWERLKRESGQYDAMTLVKKPQQKRRQEAVRRMINTPRRQPSADKNVRNSERSYEKRNGLSRKNAGSSKRRERGKRSEKERLKRINGDRSARQGANLNANQRENGTASEVVIIAVTGLAIDLATDLVTEGAGNGWMTQGMSASLPPRLIYHGKKSTGWSKKHLLCL